MKALSGFGCTFKCSTIARIGLVVFNANFDGFTFHSRFAFVTSMGLLTSNCSPSSKRIWLKFSVLISLTSPFIIVTQQENIFDSLLAQIKTEIIFRKLVYFFHFRLFRLWFETGRKYLFPIYGGHIRAKEAIDWFQFTIFGLLSIEIK